MDNQISVNPMIKRNILPTIIGALLLLSTSAWTTSLYAENGEEDSYGNEEVYTEESESTSTWSARLLNIMVDTVYNQPVVKIKTSAQVKSSISYLSNPDRLLMKVRNTLLVWKPTILNVDQDPLARIRAAQHDSDAWVVLDLMKPIKWTRQNQSNGIILSLSGQAESQAANPPVISEPVNEPEQQFKQFKPDVDTSDMSDATSYQVVDIAAEDLGNKTKLVITTDGLARYKVERQKSGKNLELTLVDATLAWRKKNLTGLPIGPIRRVSAKSKQAGPTQQVIININMTKSSPYVVFKDQNQIIMEFNNPDVIGRQASRSGNIRSLVSVDLENASLISVLRALAQDVKFDLILTPGVQQLKPEESVITLTINQQPFEQVLDFICRPRKMAYAVNNNTLRVGLVHEFSTETKVFTMRNTDVNNANIKESIETALTDGAKSKVVVDSYANRVIVSAIPSDLIRIEKMIDRMDVQRRLITKSFILNYVDAQKVEVLLKSQLSSLGSIKQNKTDNSIVVTDIPGNIPELTRIVTSIDTKAKQIMIEARIVEVSRSNQLDLGVDWNVANLTTNPNYTVNQTPLAGGSVGTLTIGALQQGVDINATISVMETKGLINTISNPRIATINKEEATLKASQSIPYVSSVVSNGVVSQMVEYLELPIILKVTPQVTKGNQVLLSPLNITVTTPVDSSSPPKTTTRSATTQMMVKDGETIAIGGMVRDEESTTDSKIPLLGDIPLLGFFFKSSVTKKNKIELVVFLTTHILE